jgi:hypothetical protein
LDLGCQILDGLLEINKRHPSDQVTLLSGGLIGKGGGIQKASLASLGIPLNHGVHLLIGDCDLG